MSRSSSTVSPLFHSRRSGRYCPAATPERLSPLIETRRCPSSVNFSELEPASGVSNLEKAKLVTPGTFESTSTTKPKLARDTLPYIGPLEKASFALHCPSNRECEGHLWGHLSPKLTLYGL